MGTVTKLKTTHRRRPVRAASQGEYGAIPYDRVMPYARALIPAIERELPEADYFTREDLIHLSVFGHISTISRYRYVCAAVHIVIRERKMVELNRGELALPGKAKFHPTGGTRPVAEEYGESVWRLVRKVPVNQHFTVMDIVGSWKSDPHLTENVKRGIVRRALKGLFRAGAIIEAAMDFAYFREDEG